MIVTLDFETYYDYEYSLTKMPEVNYLLDPRFQVIMLAVKIDNGPTNIYTHDQFIKEALDDIDWDNVSLLSHNTRFDGAILAWHYGKIPRLYLDTLSMARALTHAQIGSSSLAQVAAHLGLPAKGDAVHRMIGRTRESLSPAELAEYATYCVHDTNLCYTIFNRFLDESSFPESELRVIDLALRMFIEPQAKLDPFKLAEYLNLVRAEKAQALAQIGYMDKSVFSSNEKFARLLEAQGVTVPEKTSKTTGEVTWALAKNDRAFKELLADDEQPAFVQALLAVRVGAKSTIDETRSATLLNLAQRDWGPCRGQGWMPVPYRYFGAHTGRFSGDGGYNFANLRRGSPIRDAICAPEGYMVVHRDASQIECRVLAWLAGCKPLLEAFREGRDVYSEFATRFYRRKISKADASERFTGKTAVLSLGYGAGAERFRHALFIGAGGVSVDLSIDAAQKIVYFYRDTYAEIPELWDRATNLLVRMIHMAGNRPLGQYTLTEFFAIPVIVPQPNRLWLPSGMCIQYPALRVDTSTTGDMIYTGPHGEPRKIYGGKCVENICQALARIIVTDVMLRVYQQTGYRPFMGTYDSWDYMIPAEDAQEFDGLLEHEFSFAPIWAPDLPLASEGSWGHTLLKAEGKG